MKIQSVQIKAIVEATLCWNINTDMTKQEQIIQFHDSLDDFLNMYTGVDDIIQHKLIVKKLKKPKHCSHCYIN